MWISEGVGAAISGVLETADFGSEVKHVTLRRRSNYYLHNRSSPTITNLTIKSFCFEEIDAEATMAVIIFLPDT